MFCLFTDPIINNRICMLVSGIPPQQICIRRFLFPAHRCIFIQLPLCSDNFTGGFSSRSLHYMIFYFLKELFSFPFSVPPGMFFTSCVVITLHFLSAGIAPASFVYSLTNVNFLLYFFPLSHSAFPLFSFVRFGSAKVKTFFLFPKLIFFYFSKLLLPTFNPYSFPPFAGCKGANYF